MTNTKTNRAIADMLAEIESDTFDPGPGHDAAPLRAIITAVQATTAAEQAVQDAVDAARERGVTWETIGRTLGVSRQAALKRFRRPDQPAQRPGPKPSR